MGFLKTHSHTSNGLAMEPGTRKEKQLKETQTLQQGKSHSSKTRRIPPVGRQKRLYDKRPQKRHYDKANFCQKKGEHRRQHKGDVMPKPPADHWHGGG